MKTSWWFAAAIIGAVSILGCTGSGATDPAGAHIVKMTSTLKYDPAEITIKVGETVNWKNSSIMDHTVTADPSLAKRAEHVSLPEGAQPFNSGNISPGKSFSYTFTVTGTYKYFCIPHESMGMIGVVVVKPPD